MSIIYSIPYIPPWSQLSHTSEHVSISPCTYLCIIFCVFLTWWLFNFVYLPFLSFLETVKLTINDTALLVSSARVRMSSCCTADIGGVSLAINSTLIQRRIDVWPALSPVRRLDTHTIALNLSVRRKCMRLTRGGPYPQSSVWPSGVSTTPYTPAHACLVFPFYCALYELFVSK